jgi:exodeoxyribonuclease VII large subunit
VLSFDHTRIRFRPTDGLHVRARGKLSIYAPRGEYELVVEALDPVGAGALQIAFEQMRDRLKAEGLFAKELKRPLPVFPRRVGIVTSPTGAPFAIFSTSFRDARARSMCCFRRRACRATLLDRILPARSGSSISITNARWPKAGRRSRRRVDRAAVVVVQLKTCGRFNQEEVARAIRKSTIP